MGICALAVALVLVGCGQAHNTAASLEVTCIPEAEVFVDGVSRGTTGSPITLSAGEHKVEVRLDKFTTFEKTVTLNADETTSIETVLMPQDPSDPTVIAKLGEAFDIEVAPFVAPRTTRGGRSKRVAAMLLWPNRDVRKDGLVNYAIEADETYAGDASLEFRHGRKVLYREAFEPESVTTIRSIPAEVLEHVKVNSRITWGLYFEDRRRPIKATFRIVQRPKAERQLEKLRTSRHMQRQPLITRQIMGATILENNRLYSEALVANLKIATDHPNSTQPYRGIVTTLRRLDAEDSNLFSFVSPFVSGRGGHAGINRRRAGVRTATSDLGIAAWAPLQAGSAPVVADATPGATPGGAAGRMGPGGAGVAPADRGSQAATAKSGDPAAAVTPSDDPAARLAAQAAVLRDQSTQAQAASSEAQALAAEAAQAVEAAKAEAVAAEQSAATAEAAATAARDAVENAEEPTREQQEAMARTGSAAEEAREAALVARASADEAGKDAETLATAAQAAAAQADALRTALAEVMAGIPGAQTPEDATSKSRDDPLDPARTGESARSAVVSAEGALEQAGAALDSAQAELATAEAANQSAPSEDTANRLREAEATAGTATKALEEARAGLATAQKALKDVSGK